MSPLSRRTGAARDIKFPFSVFKMPFNNLSLKKHVYYSDNFFSGKINSLLSALNLEYCGKLIGEMKKLLEFIFFLEGGVPSCGVKISALFSVAYPWKGC